MANLYGKYTFEILSAAGSIIADLSTMAENRHLNFVRNNTYTATFQIDLYLFERYCRSIGINPRSIIGIGINTVRVKRMDVIIFTGVIENIEANIEVSAKITIKAVGWLEVFKSRFTAALDQHTNETYGTIMWNDINTSQLLTNGSWGITRGTDQTTDLRDKKHENKNVKDALIDITNLSDGPDFEFTPNKVFNTYLEMGAVRSEFEFNFPGNIKNFNVTTDSKAMANYVLVKGQGIGDAQLTSIVQDSDSQAAYRLRQYILNKSDVSEATTLTKHGQEYIDTHKAPIEILNVTLDGNRPPYFGSYWLGDRVMTVVTGLEIFAHINAYYKLDEIDLEISDNDDETVRLKVTV